jgi:H+/Cl- antiporter ClcA
MAPSRAYTHFVYVQDVHARLPRQTTLWLVAFAGIVGYLLLRYIVLKLPVLPVYTVGPLPFSTFGPLVAMGILLTGLSWQ